MKVPDTSADYVLFVTFGTRTGEHEFAEEIDQNGVLTWQSQPRQRLSSPVIRDFIAHNDLTSTVHLFLRTTAKQPYTYLGPLGYDNHDPEKEQPAHLSWQLLAWPIPDDVLLRMRLAPVPTTADSARIQKRSPVEGLTKADPPAPPKSRGNAAHGLRKRAYLPDQDARNAELGLAGELLVVQHEKGRLVEAGKPSLAEQVVHVAVVEGDGAGYDVRSYETDGSLRHIEVKTTRAGKSSGFFISPNEVAFSEQHATTFVLVRVFDYEAAPSRGTFFELRGPITRHFDLSATEFRATIRVTEPEEAQASQP